MTVPSPKKNTSKPIPQAAPAAHQITNQFFLASVGAIAGHNQNNAPVQDVGYDEEEPARQEKFLRETNINCGPHERSSLIRLSQSGSGFSFLLLKKLKVLDHLIWDQQQCRHFVRLVGAREVVASCALLFYVFVCLALLAYVIHEELWGRASAPHYAWSAGSALVAVGFLALLYNLLWVPLHEALPVKLALAEMHDSAVPE